MAGLGSVAFLTYPPYAAAYDKSNRGRLLSFKLGGGEVTMADPLPPLSFPQPPAQVGNANLVERGSELFTWHCRQCHANNGRGVVPDLRYLGQAKHALFDQIVREGLLRAAGMPRFDDLLSKEDTDAIQAHLIDAAWRAYNAEQAKLKKDNLIDVAQH